MATRRRKLEPRRLREPRVLGRFLVLAGVAIVLGAGLVGGLRYLLTRFFPERTALATLVPALLLVLTFFVVAALLFFGIRAYLSGSPGRPTLERRRGEFRVRR